jgi:hypothetical protein
MTEPTPEQIDAFIRRWESSGAAERANYALFLSELCILLDLPTPEPTGPDNAHNGYVFERAITRKHPDRTTSTGFIDLYRRGSLVLESKQGTHATGDAETNSARPPRPATANAAPRPSTRPWSAPSTRPAATSPPCRPRRVARRS